MDSAGLICGSDFPSYQSIKWNPGPSGEDTEWYRPTSRCRITYPAPGAMDRLT